jgi:uncharacterized membrane protein
MSKAGSVFLYLGTYPNEAEAQADYELVKDLRALGAVGGYDAAVVTKDAEGKVHVNKDETSTRRGTWGGIVAGAVVGVLFPPSILAAAAVGGAVGGVGGHLWKGMSRSDVKELGEMIDEGEAALIVVGESQIEKAELKAVKHLAKELDVKPEELEAEIAKAAQTL